MPRRRSRADQVLHAGLTTGTESPPTSCGAGGVKFAWCTSPAARSRSRVLGEHVDATVPNLSIAMRRLSRCHTPAGHPGQAAQQVLPRCPTLPSLGLNVALPPATDCSFPSRLLKRSRRPEAAVEKVLTAPAHEELRKRMEELTLVPTTGARRSTTSTGRDRGGREGVFAASGSSPPE